MKRPATNGKSRYSSMEMHRQAHVIKLSNFLVY